MNVVKKNIRRNELSLIDALARNGVATIHEAMGRVGLMRSYMRPVWPSRDPIGGNAVTVSIPPADNWMIHVAVEQCQDGDILVVAPTSPSDAGYFGELLATSLASRGVRGLVIEGGVRDAFELEQMGFPTWSRFISAQGTVKATLGSVNVPVICGGMLVNPGDTIVADNDGVVVVPGGDLEVVLKASHARAEKEAATRKRLATGELGLDIYAMREALAAKGLKYID